MNKLKLLCGLLSVFLLCGCTFVQPPATEPTEPPAPTITTPPETEPPTEAPTESPTEPPTEAPTEPPTEAPTEPPSTDDDDYNLVFYWLCPMQTLGNTFFICADGSDEWVQLNGVLAYSFPFVNFSHHNDETRPLAAHYGLDKVQCNYPGEISDTWTILCIKVGNFWAYGDDETDWNPQRDGMIYNIQKCDGIKITGKDTLLIQGFGETDTTRNYTPFVFSTTTMVCCTQCPEEWLAQWDGIVEEAPSYHGGTEEPWNFHLTHGN
jgi:hypothetical protein